METATQKFIHLFTKYVTPEMHINILLFRVLSSSPPSCPTST